MTISDLEGAGFALSQDGAEAAKGEMTDAFTSDLLSDVMANAPADSVLITIQAHKNTVAVATLADVRAVIVCSGREIPEDMKEAARNEGIALLSTEDNQFRASIRVARLLGAL
jgi:hypothetical protein